MGAGAAGMQGSIIGYQMGQGVYTAGKSMRQGIQQKMDAKTAARTQVGQAYNNYVHAQGLENDPTTAKFEYNRIARDVLNGRDVNSFAAEDQQLAQSLSQFKNTFEQMGTSQKNIAKDMEKTLMKMQDLQARQNTNNP